jgi:hypothetical protein
VRTFAALVFIAGVATLAIFLAQRPTVADGRVIEADLLAQLRDHGVVGLACDPRIPIGKRGAVFACTATLDDGAVQHVEYTMDRAGGLTARVTSSMGATQRRIPSSSDPWDN